MHQRRPNHSGTRAESLWSARAPECEQGREDPEKSITKSTKVYYNAGNPGFKLSTMSSTRNLETPPRKSKNQGRFFLVNFLFATKAKTTLLSIWGDQPDFKLAKHIPRTTRHGSAGVKFSVFRYFWPSKRGGTKTENPKLVFGSK